MAGIHEDICLASFDSIGQIVLPFSIAFECFSTEAHEYFDAFA